MSGVFVVGGTNFIGPEVVRALVAAGDDVAVLHRGQHEVDLPEGVVHIHADRSAAAEHVRRVRPDVIVDMAPIHADHATEIMRAAGAESVSRVVALSSGDVYRAFDVVNGRDRHLQPVPLTEDSEVRGRRYPYADRYASDHPMARYDKLDVEERVLTSNAAEGVIFRLPMVFGPRDGQHRLRPLLRRMDDGMPSIVMARSVSGWKFGKAYSADVADAVVLGCHHPTAPGHVFNVQSFAGTELEWAQHIAAAADWRGDLVVAPDDVLPEGMQSEGDLRQDLVFDATRLRTELGWEEQVGFEGGIAETIRWERTLPDDDFVYDREAESALAHRGEVVNH